MAVSGEGRPGVSIVPAQRVSGGASGAGYSLTRILSVPFTSTVVDFKAAGDGIYDYEDAKIQVNDSAVAPLLESVSGQGLRIGIAGGRQYSNAPNAPRLGVFVPEFRGMGPGVKLIGAWTIDYANSTLTMTAASKSVAIAAKQVAAPRGAEYMLNGYQGSGSAVLRFSRCATAGATSNAVGGSIGRLPGLIAVQAGPISKGWEADNGTTDDYTSAADPLLWAPVGELVRAAPAAHDPWGPYVDPLSEGTIFDLACWNTVADASGEYVQATKFELWALSPTVET